MVTASDYGNLHRILYGHEIWTIRQEEERAF